MCKYIDSMLGIYAFMYTYVHTQYMHGNYPGANRYMCLDSIATKLFPFVSTVAKSFSKVKIPCQE